MYILNLDRCNIGLLATQLDIQYLRTDKPNHSIECLTMYRHIKDHLYNLTPIC